MHAPVVTEVPSVHNDHQKTLQKKSSSERILRTRRASDLSKTESSGSSSDTPNNEECDSCGGSGNLVTCDGCYGAYHSECFNPTSQELEPFCSDCTVSINAKGTSSPSSGIEIVEIEPKTPVSSPKVKPKASEKEPVISSPKRRRGKQLVKLCEVCDQFGELIVCVVCSKSYHTYCVDLVQPTTHFKCSDHENVELIPREVFPLRFTPEKWTSSEDDKDTTLESPKKSRLNAQEKDIPDLLLTLKNASPDASDDLPPSILKNFTPKFIEFLAWQHLNQIHKMRQSKGSDGKSHT